MAANSAKQRPTVVLHLVLWLTVLIYLITSMDRAIISTAAPEIHNELGFSLITMGWILGMFQFAYAIFQIAGGWLGDRFGMGEAGLFPNATRSLSRWILPALVLYTKR
jgi:MFS transporter, ACS family, glucarate transporter